MAKRGHLQWSEPERKHFIQHVLPLRGTDGKWPDLTDAAAAMQEAMARIYPQPRRIYNHDLFYQYWYRKHNTRATERGEEELQILPGSASHPGPSSDRQSAPVEALGSTTTHSKIPKRAYQHFAYDADDETTIDRDGSFMPLAMRKNTLNDAVLDRHTGSSFPTSLRRGKIVAPIGEFRLAQGSAENRSSVAIHPPSADFTLFPIEGFNIGYESYEDIYEEEKREYQLLLASQKQSAACGSNKNTRFTEKLVSNVQAQDIAHSNYKVLTDFHPPLAKKMPAQPEARIEESPNIQTSLGSGVIKPFPSRKTGRPVSGNKASKLTAAESKKLKSMPPPPADLFPASNPPRRKGYSN